MKLFRTTSLTTLWVWLAIFSIFPLLLVLVTSFLTRGDLSLIEWILTFSNYKQLLNIVYLRILVQSFELAFLSTFFCLLAGYPLAFFLARMKSHCRGLLLVLVIIPFWTSSLIRTYAMLAILKTHGLINSFLLTLGIIHQPLLMLYTNTAVLIGCVYNLLPFMILPLYANIEKLDERMIEAARDLGANRLQLFYHVLFPLTVPGILAGSLLVFLPAMTLFYIPVLLGGAKSLLLGNLIQNQFLSMRDWPGGAATSITLTVLMLILLLIYRRFNKGKDAEALLL